MGVTSVKTATSVVIGSSAMPASNLDKVSGIIPPNIKISQDGRLLLVGGNHGVERMFSVNGPALPDSKIAVFIDNHRNRTIWTKSRGIAYSQWVFPDPIVFNGAMPENSVRSIFKSFITVDSMDDNLHYPLDIINGFPERQTRTDSHYSPIGNMHLAAEVARQMLSENPKEAVDDLQARISTKYKFVGDLGVQCRPNIEEYLSSPPLIEEIKVASNGIVSGNMGIISLVRSPRARTDRTLLIFGDSFFRSMLTELARYWKNIVFMRTKFFHAEMVHAISPDDVVCGLAERYFPTTESDRDRPHFLAYPLILGRGTNPDKEFSALWGEMVDSKKLGKTHDFF